MKKTAFVTTLVFLLNFYIYDDLKGQNTYSSPWEYFTGKYEIDFSDGNDEYSGNLTVRMRKDSICWFSISAALGIQILKGKITKDSAIIVDLYSQKYYSLAIQDLSKFQNVIPIELSLRSLQELILGGKIIPDLKITDSLGMAFRGLPPNESLTGKIENSHIKEYSFQNTSTKNDFNIVYRNRLEQDEYFIPENIDLRSQSDSKIIRINFSLKSARANLIPSYPFAIPKDYKNETIGF